MTTLENRRGIPDKFSFDIGLKRALSITAKFASENNSDIGLKQLHQGVRAEIGDFLVEKDLLRKGFVPIRLLEDLDILEAFGEGKTKPQAQRDPRDPKITSNAKTAIEHAVKLALSRENPIAQRANTRDLLESIAVVARQKVIDLPQAS